MERDKRRERSAEESPRAEEAERRREDAVEGATSPTDASHQGKKKRIKRKCPEK